ncbi:MAG TPA: hypothetical protein VHU82_00780 [Vicinamibacterales bacterium]|jgi:hypothetical protein|nr:hypothetical protein [Vicinamibacterales bacterium]
MRDLFKTLVLATLLLVPAATANAQITIGVRIGAPPPPRAYAVPPRPGPDYTWVEGYQYPEGGHYKWHDGYWTRPPYQGAYWVAPYHSGERYVPGRWEGSRGVVAHDHRWDKSKQRDENRRRR